MDVVNVLIGRKIKNYRSVELKTLFSGLKCCGKCMVELDSLPMPNAPAKGKVSYTSPNPHNLGQKKFKSVRWDVPLILLHDNGCCLILSKCAISRITDDGFCFETKAVVGKHLAGAIFCQTKIKEE